MLLLLHVRLELLAILVRLVTSGTHAPAVFVHLAPAALFGLARACTVFKGVAFLAACIGHVVGSACRLALAHRAVDLPPVVLLSRLVSLVHC